MYHDMHGMDTIGIVGASDEARLWNRSVIRIYNNSNNSFATYSSTCFM